MAVFGWVFVAAGVAYLLLAAVLRVRFLEGHWANTDVPVSRAGDAAWGLCILSWGLAAAVPPPDLVPVCFIAACLASFAVLIPAGLHDQRLHRRRQAEAGRVDDA